jgi:hypothetical protein
LRKAFEGFLPEKIIWREKVPIDVGTGSMNLRLDKILNRNICQEEMRI